MKRGQFFGLDTSSFFPNSNGTGWRTGVETGNGGGSWVNNLNLFNAFGTNQRFGADNNGTALSTNTNIGGGAVQGGSGLNAPSGGGFAGGTNGCILGICLGSGLTVDKTPSG